MSKKDKYQWEIGRSLPDLDEHSQIKHSLITDYIKCYIEVYMSKATVESLPLTIVNGFAGGGCYNNIITGTEVKGSPFPSSR